MAFLNKIKRGSHGITIDHDLSTGLSRDLFVLDEVSFSDDSMLINSSRIMEFQAPSLLPLMTPFSLY